MCLAKTSWPRRAELFSADCCHFSTSRWCAGGNHREHAGGGRQGEVHIQGQLQQEHTSEAQSKTREAHRTTSTRVTSCQARAFFLVLERRRLVRSLASCTQAPSSWLVLFGLHEYCDEETTVRCDDFLFLLRCVNKGSHVMSRGLCHDHSERECFRVPQFT